MSLSTQYTPDSPSRLGLNVTLLVVTSRATGPSAAPATPVELGPLHLCSHLFHPWHIAMFTLFVQKQFQTYGKVAKRD